MPATRPSPLGSSTDSVVCFGYSIASFAYVNEWLHSVRVGSPCFNFKYFQTF